MGEPQGAEVDETMVVPAIEEVVELMVEAEEQMAAPVIDITIREIGPRVSAVEGHVQFMASQMVQAVDRMEQIGIQMEQGQQTATQRDKIQQLQTMMSEMSRREGTLMQCILGMDKRLAELEKKKLTGPQ
ncbi:hypothetical protein Tco_0894166 [Tanacetum coccineum]|uniref:Uncharacterized protein n=1 Tax=Tanacetum coccineum TaxID=301880 RepID=A0ABQ5CCA7_9ASTR